VHVSLRRPLNETDVDAVDVVNAVEQSPEVLAAVARLDAMATKTTTPCGDGAMVWREFGAGPTLVLLHGGFGSWLHWFRCIEPLAAHYRLLVPDLPGLGESADAPEPYDGYSIAAIVADGLRMLVPPGELFDMAGFSFGGVIGGHVAAMLDGTAASMTFVGSGGMGLGRPLRRKMVSWRKAETPESLMEAHGHNLRALMLERPESVDETALHIQWRNTNQARTKSAPISLRKTLNAALPGTHVALAGIWGEIDITAVGFLDERRDFLTALQADAPFVVVPNAGHWVMYESPDAFITALQSVLAGSRARHGALL
jgi:2-hydroxy-6-oxonona-2,4-dienedioate hydrolase